MTVFAHSDYRKALRATLEKHPLNQRQLAEASAVQPPYLSAVFAGRAQLNSDQLFAAGRALGLDDESLDYLLLLLDLERAQHTDRRRMLKTRIEGIRRAHLRSDEHLTAAKISSSDVSLAEYYLDPNAMLVHVALGLPRFQGRLDAVAKALGLSDESAEATVEVLQQLGYVVAAGSGRYSVKVRHRHLPEDSPLCSAHQAMQRLRSTEHLQRVSRKRRYGFAATFSADEETRKRIQGEFLEFARRCEKIVKTEAKPENVYQMNFDLFPWND